MRSSPAVTLVPFTEHLLAAVQPWFGHPEVRRRLSGPEGPARELRLMHANLMATNPEGRFRGRLVLRAHSWVALDIAGVPVAKVGGEVYDRWTRFDGSRPDRPMVDRIEPGPAMGLAYVVSPDRWRQGFGAAALRSAVAHPSVADVRLFALGIDADNEASRCCAAAAGFAVDDDTPDWEGMVFHLLRR